MKKLLKKNGIDFRVLNSISKYALRKVPDGI